MGVLESIRKLFGRNVKIYYGHSGNEIPTIEAMSPRDLYSTQANLYSVVSFLADSVAHLPLKVYERKDENVRLRDRSSVVAKLLYKPNSSQTEAEFMQALCIEYLLYGEALIWVLPDVSDSGFQLRIIPSEWVTERICSNNFYVDKYKIKTTTGGELIIDARNIICFKEYLPGSPASHLSPISALKQTLIEQIQADKFRTKLWRSSGRLNAYISRPANVQPWTKETRDAWTRAFREAWSAGGSKEGSIPILEDGMTLNPYTFNSREAQYTEGKQLSREDVAAAYHVNAALIWKTSTQTYASAKDNARALYSDCLGPLLQIFQQRINSFLLPMLGMDPQRYYVEFDIEEKLKGSFEERASIIQSAVGGPWMTRDEARAMNNMSPLPNGEGEGVIVPLNVLISGQASPQDSTADAYKSSIALLSNTCDCGHHHVKEASVEDNEPIKLDTDVSNDEVDDFQEVLIKFFARQQKSVIAKLGVKAADAPWWDKERWDKELSDDLYAKMLAMSSLRGKQFAKKLNSEYKTDIIEKYLRKMADSRANAINTATYEKINYIQENEDYLMSEENTSEEPKTVNEVYDKRISFDSGIIALSLASFVMHFTTNETVEQAKYQGKLERTRVYKTWVTGPNPRDEHAAMNGEKVDFNSKFSNGADWIGDDILGPSGTCRCNCRIEVTIEKS